MLDSRFSVRSAAPQVIVPQPVLSLVCVGAVVSPATWPESACRAGVVLFLLLPLICLRNLLLRLTTLWLTRLVRLQILSPFVLLLVLILQHLFLLVTAPVTVPTAPASVAAPVTVSAAPASVDAAPTTVSAAISSPAPAALQVPACSFYQNRFRPSSSVF